MEIKVKSTYVERWEIPDDTYSEILIKHQDKDLVDKACLGYIDDNEGLTTSSGPCEPIYGYGDEYIKREVV